MSYDELSGTGDYDQQDPYKHDWRSKEELPGYDATVDFDNQYWIFDIPYLFETLALEDLKLQTKGNRNGYRLILEVKEDHENGVWVVTGRYWYTWGHYGDKHDEQSSTGIISGASLYPLQEESEKLDPENEPAQESVNWTEEELRGTDFMTGFYDKTGEPIYFECTGINGEYHGSALSGMT